MSGITDSDVNRVARLIWKGDSASAIVALDELKDKNKKTTTALKKDSEEQSASFRRTEESAHRLRDSMVGMLGVLGIGGVAFGLKSLKDSAVQLQANQAQLATSLKFTGTAADGNARAMKNLAESMSTHGGFGTVENLQALTQFVRETHNVTQAQSMLSLATNIARGRSMDLASSQMVVARAYTGNVGRLQQLLGPMVAAREAQVGLTLAHQKQISTIQNEAAMMGRLGGPYLRQQEIAMHLTAQQQALAQMTDKHATAQRVLALATQEFAGATAAYSKTTQGQASNLSNSFRNLKEELGTALLPAMNWIIARGATMAEWMAKNRTVVLAVAGAFATLGAALGIRELVKAVHGLWTDLGKLIERMPIFGAASQEAGTEAAVGADAARLSWNAFFTGTLIGIGLVALLEIATHWKQFEAGVINVWHAITGAVKDAWTWIKSAVNDGVNWVWSKIKWLGDEAKKLIADTPLGGLIGFGSNLLSGHVTHAFGDLAQGVSGGIVQSNGSIGVPLRNLWQANGGQQSNQPVNVNVHPNNVAWNVDGRQLANSVLRYTVNRAARGPSNMVGGSLMTGAPGLG